MVSSTELMRFVPTGPGAEQTMNIPPRAAAQQADARHASHANQGHQAPRATVRDYIAVQSHSPEQLLQAMQASGGNQSRAAQAVGLTARQFAYRLRKLGLGSRHNGDNL